VHPLVGGVEASLDAPSKWPSTLATQASWKSHNAKDEREFNLQYELMKGDLVSSDTHCLRVHKQKKPCACPPGKGKKADKGGL